MPQPATAHSAELAASPHIDWEARGFTERSGSFQGSASISVWENGKDGFTEYLHIWPGRARWLASMGEADSAPAPPDGALDVTDDPEGRPIWWAAFGYGTGATQTEAEQAAEALTRYLVDRRM